MSNNLDWLSLIERDWPLAPEWFVDLRNQADRVFVRRENVESKASELQQLAATLSAKSNEQLRMHLGMQAALIGRQFSLALETDAAPEECFRLFEQLSKCGFQSPVDKSRYVVLLLIYLEKFNMPANLEPLVSAMKEQLETCRIGCEENLQVLQTFLDGQGNSDK